MFARKPLVIAAFLLFATGCAYSSAMGRGSRSENAGDWAAAYSAYDEALKKKPEEAEAREARERAATALVDQALREAGDALALGDFEVAMEKLEVAVQYDSDRPEVYELRKEAREKMARRFADLWAGESWDHAYDMAVRTRELFPDSEHLDKAFSDLRKHYVSTAEAELKRKQYKESLATLRIIVKYESDRQGDIAALEQKILQSWGEDLARRASSNSRSRKYGAAAVLYARAYEVAGRPEHLKKARELTARLKPEGKMSVSLRVTGARGRTATIQEGIVAGLSGVPDTAVVSKNAKLDIRVSVGAQNCTETDKITPTEKDFISGQVEEPNPEWHTLTNNLAAQREIEATSTQKAEVLWPDVQSAEENLKKLDAALQAAQRELAAATTSKQEAQAQLDSNKARRDQLQIDLEGLQATGATATADQVRTQLGQLGRIISDWSGEVIQRTEAESTASRRVKSLEIERGPAKETLERLQTGYQAIMKDKTAAQSQASDLSVKLGATPETVWKDVHEMLKYDIHDWTRTCTAPVTVTLRPRWETNKPTEEAYTPSHETKDRSHIGHDKAEVKEDPKSFPDADADLIAKGDKATIAEVASWLDKMAEDHFRVRRTDTAVALVEHPIDATTELVRLYVGARDRLDESSVKMFQAHLLTHFGLEKIELLDPSDSH